MRLPSGYTTTDYGPSGASKGWGAGWPQCDAINGGQMTTITLKISGVRFQMHRLIAPLAAILMNEVERRGYRAVVGWGPWGAECRQISGTNRASNHSWGLAFDLNAPNNPYTSSGQHDIPEWVFALFRRYGFGVGADYSGRKDWMHFEFMGTPNDAAYMTALALREFGVGGPVTPPPGGGGGGPVITPKTYTVKAGDSLGVIAARFKLSVANLAAWNKITNPNVISVGQVLRLTKPPLPPAPAPGNKVKDTAFWKYAWKKAAWPLVMQANGWVYGELSGPANVISGMAANGSDAAHRKYIKLIQAYLKAIKYYTGALDGLYGSGTVAAVKKFQRTYMGHANPSGRVNRGTWLKMGLRVPPVDVKI